jgi:hypothetical protein
VDYSTNVTLNDYSTSVALNDYSTNVTLNEYRIIIELLMKGERLNSLIL